MGKVTLFYRFLTLPGAVPVLIEAAWS